MSGRILTVATLLTTLTVQSAVGQAKPNFAGTWKMNTEKSDPMGGGGGMGGGMGGGGMMAPLVITQTATELVEERTMGDQIRKSVYYLDGRESTNPGMRGGESKSKASWDGNALVIETTSMMGENTITTKSVRTLSEDGKAMTVVTTRPGPSGETTTRKTVYDKQ
ncbi:MAG TPA: hypothetical protein VJK71_03140 [Gemmatimonadales bacterium]|nr:hypothetical protein [Gemmatimonadales bacterium]